jgi:acyl carrier protein
MPDSLHVRLEVLARDVFDDEQLKFHDTTTARDVEGWDSLGHVNLMFSIEQEFGVTFSEEEFTSFANIGELKKLLERKGVN